MNKKIIAGMIIGMINFTAIAQDNLKQPSLDNPSRGNVKDFIFQNKPQDDTDNNFNQSPEDCQDLNWVNVVFINYYKDASYNKEITQDDMERMVHIHHDVFCHSTIKKDYATVSWALKQNKPALIQLMRQTRIDLDRYNHNLFLPQKVSLTATVDLPEIIAIDKAQSDYVKYKPQYKNISELELYTNTHEQHE